MKTSFTFVFIGVFALCGTRKDQSYTGSTPAAPAVRTFLGIPQTEAVDFIRWDLTLAEEHYRLTCNYGIGKPNTNGFMNGGKRIVLTGLLTRENNQCRLSNGSNTLLLADLNNNLLHVMDFDNHLLAGTAGWSYMLNNLEPIPSAHTAWTGQPVITGDSVSFVGRTPCGVPGFSEMKACYKLKWAIVLYKGGQSTTGKYRMRGTPWRNEGGIKGIWKMVEEKDHRLFYLLNDDKGNQLARLLALDKNVLAFTDSKGNLLVGNLDFSYTLNKRW